MQHEYTDERQIFMLQSSDLTQVLPFQLRIKNRIFPEKKILRERSSLDTIQDVKSVSITSQRLPSISVP